MKKTIAICGGLGELGQDYCKTHNENKYVLIDIVAEPEWLSEAVREYEYIKADITDGERLENAISNALGSKKASIDALLCTPAHNAFKRLSDMSYEEIDLDYRTKIYGYTYLIKAFLPLFNDHCSVVCVGSVHGTRTKPQHAPYAAANAAIEALVRALATEYPNKHRFNVVSPGGIVGAHYKERYSDIWEEASKSGQIQPIENITNVIDFLFDDKSSAINGQNITLDGGISSLRAESTNWQ